MPARPLTDADIRWLEQYRSEVVTRFKSFFDASRSRFDGGERLISRFDEALGSVRRGVSFRSVDAAQNELCISRALLLNTNPEFAAVLYEPPLTGSTKSIDFQAKRCGTETMWVDVKTIQPIPTDRWDQFEKAHLEQWFPERVRVVLNKDWLGGEIWHQMFAARARMLEYSLEFEQKIRDARLKEQPGTSFTLAFCGAGVDLCEDQLEDFVQFYETGKHRADDPFAKLEEKYMQDHQLSLEQTISRFAYLKRRQGELFQSDLNWNVRASSGPHTGA